MRLLPPRPLAGRLLFAALTSLSLPAVALAQTTTITDIVTTGPDGFRLTVPTVETTGANLDEAAVRAIFAGDFAGTADELAALDAESIRIPEIRIEFEAVMEGGTPEHSVIVYRDFELLDVADGVASSASVGGAEIETGDDITWTFGGMSSGRLDIGGILGFYGLGGKAGGTAIKPVYADLVFEGFEISSPEFNCGVGAARTDEFSARPLQHSFQEMMDVAQQVESQEAAGEKPDPEAVATLVAFYVEFLTAFRSSPAEFDGFSCAGTDDEGKALEISSGPLVIGGFEPGVYPPIEVNDFRIEVENDGWLELGNFTWKAMDFTAAVAALEAAGSGLDEAWFTANWRRLVPVFEGLSLTGFAMDIPDEDNPGQRIEASIGGFDLTLEAYRSGIPTRLAVRAEDLKVAIPPTSATDEGPDLAALGVDHLDLDYDMVLSWDEASETIVVERLAVAWTDMGSMVLSGTLGNATAALFSEDIATAMAASQALTLKQVEIDIVDEGLTPMIIALAAREEDQEPAAFRAVLSGIAQGFPLAVLGPTEDAMNLGTALRSFIDGQPNLHITATASDPAGISLADLKALEQDPSKLADKVTIVAEASGDPLPMVELPPAPARPEVQPEPQPEAQPTPEPEAADEPPAAPDLTPRQQEKHGTKQ